MLCFTRMTTHFVEEANFNDFVAEGGPSSRQAVATTANFVDIRCLNILALATKTDIDGSLDFRPNFRPTVSAFDSDFAEVHQTTTSSCQASR